MLSRRTMCTGGLAAAATSLAGAGSVRAATTGGRAGSVVVLFMRGGMSQLDTIDPKPGRPTGGPVEAMQTRVPGVSFASSLPGLARRADEMTILRALRVGESDHNRAEHLLHTGYVPQAGAAFPTLGAWVARRHGSADLPGFVRIGEGLPFGAGLLGPRYEPFVLPHAHAALSLLRPPRGLLPDRRTRRYRLIDELDAGFNARAPSGVGRTLTELRQQAARLVESGLANTFDLGLESEATRERYGKGAFGDACLLARRLVDADVPFVEVSLGGWDTHENNHVQAARLAATLDRGMTALIDDLVANGRLRTTAVLLLTEFGRSPAINGNLGRGHHPVSTPALACGGGFARARVIGDTGEDGTATVDDPITVPDLFATLAHLVGIDPTESFDSALGRPITPVDPAGRLRPALLA